MVRGLVPGRLLHGQSGQESPRPEGGVPSAGKRSADARHARRIIPVLRQLLQAIHPRSPPRRRNEQLRQPHRLSLRAGWEVIEEQIPITKTRKDENTKPCSTFRVFVLS